ncbi:hypothetical protein DFH09DRAFT_932574 [Mycena vulgaris]|nr:hypothetical protein DFH09DRAFT_932574 [Mycena vulgaris]
MFFSCYISVIDTSQNLASSSTQSESQPRGATLPSSTHLTGAPGPPFRQSVRDSSSWRWFVPCPGIIIDWDDESFWDTYPFLLHSPRAKGQLPYDLILSETPKARSPECLGAVVTADGLQPCSKCSALTLDVSIVKERAGRSYQQIRNHDTLSSEQLRAKLAVTEAKLNALKLKNLDLSDSLASARRRLSDFTQTFQFMGQNSIPALHRLLTNADKEGWSAKKTLQQCKLAVAGDYTARNYTQYEIDLAILMYELGGGGAVYALNHSIFALPSRNTIQPYRRQHNLVLSINGLRMSDISRNIAALFGPHIRRDAGKSADMIDPPPIVRGHTLSFDELATERKIDYFPETDEMGGFCVEHVSTLKTVKVGKDTHTVEEAVAAVKEGSLHISHETSVGAISRLYETGYGAKPVFMGLSCKKGPWKDMLRTMETVIEAWKRSLYGEPMYGPIMSVSSDGDHKRRLALFMLCMHSEILPGNPLYPFICNLPGLNRCLGCLLGFSGICTLLCSSEGLVVKNVCINRDLLLSWLERLPNHDWSEISIQNLLNPSDAQNVSRAIKLLLAVIEIGELDQSDFDPSEAAEFEALCLLGEAFDAMLQPFINTELTLSEQIESLIKFSHLLCALYLQNGTSFMPNQLYSDLQAMVKNAVLMVPKTRIINGQLKVFIYLLGDDVLEALFGRSRMIGGHAPNCSAGELRNRFGSAMTLDYIYDQHPELERQPRRLNMCRMRHVDHLRPIHFKRELRAESCNLEMCWSRAVKAAEFILAKYGVRMALSFADRFRRKDTDLMRPLGGKYPAISVEVDRSMANLSDGADITVPSTIDLNTVSPTNLMNEVDFDSMIARETEQPESSPPNHSLFAEIDNAGHLAHKKSVNCEDSQTISTATHFQLGNLFTTLICYNGTHLGLAIAKCTLIKRGQSGANSASVSAIPRSELHLPSSPYTISGQVFSLVPLAKNGNNPVFAWDGDFISFSLKKRNQTNGEEISRLRNLQFAVSSRLIDCNINDQAHEVSTSDIDLPFDREKTWCFTNNDLGTVWSTLWNRLLGDNSLHEKFPIFSGLSDGVFPYQIASSPELRGVCYASPIATTAIEQSIINRNACRICRKPVKDQDRQTHVGEHIMKTLRGVKDPSAQVPVSNAYPCGMCGGPTNTGNCKIAIKGGKADSDCPSAYSFLISAAKKYLPTRPCTNVPIQCTLECKETHWKYNFPQHMEERHPDWRRLISAKFIEQIRVSSDEQLALKIPAVKVTEWPNVGPPMSSLQATFSPGRKRSISTVQNSPIQHGGDKENHDSNDTRASKTRRLD